MYQTIVNPGGIHRSAGTGKTKSGLDSWEIIYCLSSACRICFSKTYCLPARVDSYHRGKARLCLVYCMGTFILNILLIVEILYGSARQPVEKYIHYDIIPCNICHFVSTGRSQTA